MHPELKMCFNLFMPIKPAADIRKGPYNWQVLSHHFNRDTLCCEIVGGTWDTVHWNPYHYVPAEKPDKSTN